ncbi:hypothetical protein ACTHOQ_00510 [Solibacillus silvestris]|uniref:hypothetical protein n=1 Tax=Solibacillus silvestris TaxID=76853 RepID=UPI003F816814
MLLLMAIVFSIPFYAYCIWGLYKPDDAIMFMDRWRYEKPPQHSELQMMLFKFSNILGIGFITVFLLIMVLINGGYSRIF